MHTQVTTYDFKQQILGSEYGKSNPIRNWLLYRLTGRDADKIALADDLKQVRARGFFASADTMHSFWTTYKQAIKLWHGQTLSGGDAHVRELIQLHDDGAFADLESPLAVLGSDVGLIDSCPPVL